MFGYELKKIVKSGFFRVSLALLLILFGVFLYLECFRAGGDYSDERYYFELADGENGFNAEVWDYYNELSANTDVASMQSREGKYSATAYGDYYLLGKIQEQIDYVQHGYAEDMRNIVEKAYKDMLEEKSAYGKKNYNKIIEIYNGIVDIKLIPQKSVGNFINLFHGEGFAIFAMVLTLWVTMLTVYVMGLEESKLLGTVVKATGGGRRRLVMVKLASIGVLIVIMSAVMLFTEFLIAKIVFGIDWRTLGAPVQSLSEYELCDTKISIFGMLILLNAAKLLLLLAVAAAAAELTVFVKSIPAAGITTVIFEAQILFVMRMNRKGYMADLKFMKLRQYNPVGLLWGSSYMKAYDYGRFVCIPVKALYECMTIAVFLILLLAAAAVIKSEYVNRRKNGTSHN